MLNSQAAEVGIDSALKISESVKGPVPNWYFALSGIRTKSEVPLNCRPFDETAESIVVPIAVQQTIDHGLNAPGGPDVSYTVEMGVAAAAAILLASWASYAMTSRLFTTSERGLATLRIKAFRHVHDLPLLTQNTERRGALVSRVTSDVDQVSQFLVFGGLHFFRGRLVRERN